MYVTTVIIICILISSEAERKKQGENNLIRGGLREMWQNLSPSHSKENNHKQKAGY